MVSYLKGVVSLTGRFALAPIFSPGAFSLDARSSVATLLYAASTA